MLKSGFGSEVTFHKIIRDKSIQIMINMDMYLGDLINHSKEFVDKIPLNAPITITNVFRDIHIQTSMQSYMYIIDQEGFKPFVFPEFNLLIITNSPSGLIKNSRESLVSHSHYRFYFCCS